MLVKFKKAFGNKQDGSKLDVTIELAYRLVSVRKVAEYAEVETPDDETPVEEKPTKKLKKSK